MLFTQEILHRNFYTGTVRVYARVMAQKLLHTSSYTKKGTISFTRSSTGVVTQEFFLQELLRRSSLQELFHGTCRTGNCETSHASLLHKLRVELMV